MMRYLASLALLLATLPATAGPVLPQGAPRDGWMQYEVPMVAGAHALCCPSAHRANVDGLRCDFNALDGTSLPHRETVTDDRLAVLLRAAGGRVVQVNVLDASCQAEVRASAPALAGIDTAASVSLLGELAASNDAQRELTAQALAALAYHAGPQATERLARFAEQTAWPLREPAIFWLGQTRGAAGAAIVERIALGKDGPQVRNHAVFSLSQSRAVDGFATIEKIARHDRSSSVRGQALFWLAKTDGARAQPVIVALLRQETAASVLEQAVFALSQLDEGSDRALIEVVRGDYPHTARRRAMFWLGQSGSDEALRFIDDALSKR